MLPKIVFTDIDGVWTDGGMYYDETGNEWKKFNTYDSSGVLLLRLVGIETVIITGENTSIVSRRAQKLKIEEYHLGIKDKVAVAEKVCSDRGFNLNEAAYIGDELNDIELLKSIGLSACPAQAPSYVKGVCDWNLKMNGGEGVFREFALRILSENTLLDEALGKFKELIQ